MLPELLCVKPKKYLDRSEFDSWISREKRCIRLMEAGKYKELEEYLQRLDEEMKGKEKKGGEVACFIKMPLNRHLTLYDLLTL